MLDVSGADSGMDHHGRIDIDLYRRLPPGQDVALEMQRDIQDKGISSIIHQAVDVAQRNGLRRFEIRREIEAFDNVARKRRIIFVDDRDRPIVKFL